MTKLYTVLEVAREDLEGQGYDTSKMTDDDMECIAEGMAEGIMETGAYWQALDNIADIMDIPKYEKI